MAGTKTFLIIVLICTTLNFLPIEATSVIDKITGIVKAEAEYVHEKIKDVAHAVHDLVHPHRHQHPVGPDHYSHHYLNKATNQNLPKPHSNTEQVSSNPNSPKGSDNVNPNFSLNESPSTNDEPTVNYEIDVRNNENGIPVISTSAQPVRQSILSFKGCAEGQRKDRAGKCRTLN